LKAHGIITIIYHLLANHSLCNIVPGKFELFQYTMDSSFQNSSYSALNCDLLKLIISIIIYAHTQLLVFCKESLWLEFIHLLNMP